MRDRPPLREQCPLLFLISVWVLLRPTELIMKSLSSLAEKTRKSDHLQMSLQRKHFILNYLTTLGVGRAGV